MLRRAAEEIARAAEEVATDPPQPTIWEWAYDTVAAAITTIRSYFPTGTAPADAGRATEALPLLANAAPLGGRISPGINSARAPLLPAPIAAPSAILPNSFSDKMKSVILTSTTDVVNQEAAATAAVDQIRDRYNWFKWALIMSAAAKGAISMALIPSAMASILGYTPDVSPESPNYGVSILLGVVGLLSYIPFCLDGVGDGLVASRFSRPVEEKEQVLANRYRAMSPGYWGSLFTASLLFGVAQTALTATSPPPLMQQIDHNIPGTNIGVGMLVIANLVGLANFFIVFGKGDGMIALLSHARRELMLQICGGSRQLVFRNAIPKRLADLTELVGQYVLVIPSNQDPLQLVFIQLNKTALAIHLKESALRILRTQELHSFSTRRLTLSATEVRQLITNHIPPISHRSKEGRTVITSHAFFAISILAALLATIPYMMSTGGFVVTMLGDRQPEDPGPIVGGLSPIGVIYLGVFIADILNAKKSPVWWPYIVSSLSAFASAALAYTLVEKFSPKAFAMVIAAATLWSQTTTKGAPLEKLMQQDGPDILVKQDLCHLFFSRLARVLLTPHSNKAKLYLQNVKYYLDNPVLNLGDRNQAENKNFRHALIKLIASMDGLAAAIEIDQLLKALDSRYQHPMDTDGTLCLRLPRAASVLKQLRAIFANVQAPGSAGQYRQLPPDLDAETGSTGSDEQPTAPSSRSFRAYSLPAQKSPAASPPRVDTLVPDISASFSPTVAMPMPATAPAAARASGFSGVVASGAHSFYVPPGSGLQENRPSAAPGAPTGIS